MVIRLSLKTQYGNKTRLEELLTQSRLNWEIVCPGMLTDGPLTQAYQVLPELYPGIRIRRIACADVADFLPLEAENPTLLRQYLALT